MGEVIEKAYAFESLSTLYDGAKISKKKNKSYNKIACSGFNRNRLTF